ncbi:acyl-CoA dehydrogenase family protein [Comamonas sp. MYb396]|uniref:acyl-CoA dehydrogenase family protein n=1 Tax=Comamonas sp. MYb396 TaxID=2745302 RepID=UPI003096FB55
MTEATLTRPVPEVADAKAPRLADLQQRFAPVFARIAEGAAEREHSRTLAHAPLQWLRESGFTALRLPPSLGGSGASLEQLVALLVDLAEADPNLTQILRPHFLFVDRVLYQGTAEAQRHWLPLVAQGATFGNATTEVGEGAVGSLQTTLVPDDAAPGQWRLHGQKFYSTGSLYADWISVLARAVVPGQPDQTVHALVAGNAAGVERLDDWRGFGQRLTGSGTTVLRDVPVPAHAVLQFRAGEPSPIVAFAQLFHLASLAGIARALSRDTLAYVQARRRVFSHGAAALPKDDPLVQQIVGQLASTAYMSELVVRDVAQALGPVLRSAEAGQARADKAQLDALELRAAQAQVAVVDAVLQAATRMFDVGGSSALAEDLRLDRHWRNARTLASHNPVIYKAKSVGDMLLNGAEPVYFWQVGLAAKNA